LKGSAAAAFARNAPLPDVGKRKLVGQQFVICQSPARKSARFEGGCIGRRMGLDQRLAPGTPAFARAVSRIAPLGQIGRAVERGTNGARQGFRRQPFGQAVHRLDGLQAGNFVRRADVIGVGHLKHALVALDLAADHPGRSHGERFVEIVAMRMEENQLHRPRPVGTAHLVGKPWRAGLHVSVDRDRHRDHRAGRGFRDARRKTPVDQSAGQMPQEIDGLGSRHPLDELADARPHAGQGGHGGEQGVEDFGAHSSVRRWADRPPRSLYILSGARSNRAANPTIGASRGRAIGV
jgi:hypothetical protein